MTDLASLRERPPGWPILHQRWSRLVFLHWPFRSDALRARVPPSVELDLFDRSAWVSLVAFTVSRMRPTLFPPIPGLSDADQINVRTYVRHRGVPGLWFLSLDATNALAVWGARLAYRLPYYHARVRVRERNDTVSFEAKRIRADVNAEFAAEWRWGSERASAQPGTLDSFLLDRYVLYVVCGKRLIQARIHHRPWPLLEVTLLRLASTMLEAQELSPTGAAPRMHGQAFPFDVGVWPPSLTGDS